MLESVFRQHVRGGTLSFDRESWESTCWSIPGLTAGLLHCSAKRLAFVGGPVVIFVRRVLAVANGALGDILSSALALDVIVPW